MAESIYSWIQEVAPPPQKPPMYHSKIDPTKLHIPASTFRETAVRKAYGVVGREVKHTVKPDAFLRAHERTTTGIDPKVMPSKFARPEATARKPAIPTKDEEPLHGLSSSKDFVTTNAVDAILALPRSKPKQDQPNWTTRPGFGKKPQYLSEIKRAIEAEHEYIQSLIDQKAMDEEEETKPMRELTQGERQELVDALKAKWGEVNRAYQRVTWKRMSPATASIGDIRWKENCERQMAQIEKDIERLSVRAPIFVVDEGRSPQGGATYGAGGFAASGSSSRA